MATGGRKTGVEETVHHEPNQDPRATHPTHKHVPELQLLIQKIRLQTP